MKYLTSTLLLSLAINLSIFSQHQNIVVGPPIGGGVPTEPSVVINPANPDEILVGAMSNNYYTSVNGGYSWSHGTLQSQWGVQADPCVLVDDDGKYYYIHLPNVINRVVCQRKENINASWSRKTSVAFDGEHDVDKEWAAYDPVNDRIYLSWTYFDEWGSANPNDSSCIYLSVSADAGESWSEPIRISDEKGDAQGGPNSMHGSYPTTGPNGEVYVSWWGPAGLMFDRSLDMGETWLPADVNITGEHINWIYNIPAVDLGVSFPVTCCDRSGGPHNGNLYICWADKRNGYNDADIFIVKSTDGGINWSDPIRVNNDPPGRHQFFPFVTVDQLTGKLWLVFFDRRNYVNTNTDVFMAASEDGGESFSNFKVSDEPFIPFSSVFFGHYIALAAQNNVVFPVWNRMDEGVSTLMGAIVDPAMIGYAEQSGLPEVELISSPNPFLESSFISFKLTKPSIVSLQLYGATSDLLITIIDEEKFVPGKYVEQINAAQLNLKSGVYHVLLRTQSGTVTTKVMLVE